MNLKTLVIKKIRNLTKRSIGSRFMMDNFDTELVVMGIKLALTQYQLPIDPVKVKCFDEFHEKYGKYVTAAQSIK